MIFRLVAPLAVLALAGWLTYRRFKKSAAAGYIPWLLSRLRTILSAPGRRSLISACGALPAIYPTPWLRWIFIGLTSSFSYLAASGFAFAVFIRRGLHGFPLLLHVVAGGIFAISLAIILIFRSKERLVFSSPPILSRLNLISFLKSPPRLFLQSAIFWIFGVSGLTLVITSLCTMLPYFSYEAQLDLLMVHRYAALISLLAAMAWLDLAFHPEH
jgi:hypothetical protein